MNYLMKIGALLTTVLVSSTAYESHQTPSIQHSNHDNFQWSELGAFEANRSRHGRIFHFTKEPTNIRVELGFAIPFLSIPVGGHQQPGLGLVDVNLGALTAGGILTAASLIFIPKLFKGLSPEITFGRSEEEAAYESNAFSRIDDVLQQHNISSTVCTQRVTCWIIDNALSKIKEGNAGSFEKIVDGIVSNKWLEGFVEGTPFQEAINNAKTGKDCINVYSKCPLTKEKLKSMAKSFVATLNL
ncbi:uncharacterized protein LOC126337802 [Schistocerca gregaria]|uniref:uncharacterized protein LOC126337802 n=1 Tax=Schistocerca gregaria TaxID=7010 RepID=UPI00211EE479|nr:uncharacterized protein LOC126337802 [Schistocerca gregaria]